MSHQNPLLERLSWIASVLSFILSILVWLLPSPINFVSTSSSSSTTIITIFRLLIFSIFYNNVRKLWMNGIVEFA